MPWRTRIGQRDVDEVGGAVVEGDDHPAWSAPATAVRRAWRRSRPDHTTARPVRSARRTVPRAGRSRAPRTGRRRGGKPGRRRPPAWSAAGRVACSPRFRARAAWEHGPCLERPPLRAAATRSPSPDAARAGFPRDDGPTWPTLTTPGLRLRGSSRHPARRGPGWRKHPWIREAERCHTYSATSVRGTHGREAQVTATDSDKPPSSTPDADVMTRPLLRIVGIDTVPQLRGPARRATRRARGPGVGRQWEVVIADNGSTERHPRPSPPIPTACRRCASWMRVGVPVATMRATSPRDRARAAAVIFVDGDDEGRRGILRGDGRGRAAIPDRRRRGSSTRRSGEASMPGSVPRCRPTGSWTDSAFCRSGWGAASDSSVRYWNTRRVPRGRHLSKTSTSAGVSVGRPLDSLHTGRSSPLPTSSVRTRPALPASESSRTASAVPAPEVPSRPQCLARPRAKRWRNGGP